MVLCLATADREQLVCSDGESNLYTVFNILPTHHTPHTSHTCTRSIRRSNERPSLTEEESNLLARLTDWVAICD